MLKLHTTWLYISIVFTPDYNIKRSNTCIYELFSLSLSYSPFFIIQFFIIYPFFALILFLPPCRALLVHHSIKLTTFNSIQNLQFIVLRSNVACSLMLHYILWFVPYHFLEGWYKNTPLHILCLSYYWINWHMPP